jgi:tetraacyldisaccharide-1-P 4'-kinase
MNQLQNQIEDLLANLQADSDESVALTAIRHGHSREVIFSVSAIAAPSRFYSTLAEALHYGRKTLKEADRNLIKAQELEAEAARLREEAAK